MTARWRRQWRCQMTTLPADAISDSYGTAAFVDKNVGNGKAVTVTGITSSGADAANYAANMSAATTASILPASLNISVSNESRPFHTANPPLTGSLTGVKAGEDVDADFVTAATMDSPMGNYPIIPQLADPQGVLANYAINTNGGMLTVVATQPVIALATNVVIYTLCAQPAPLAPLADFIGTGSSAYPGAKLTVGIMENNGPKDLLALNYEGMAVGQVGVSGAAVTCSVAPPSARLPVAARVEPGFSSPSMATPPTRASRN